VLQMPKLQSPEGLQGRGMPQLRSEDNPRRTVHGKDFGSFFL
jgi:hypothetical protein